MLQIRKLTSKAQPQIPAQTFITGRKQLLVNGVDRSLDISGQNSSSMKNFIANDIQD